MRGQVVKTTLAVLNRIPFLCGLVSGNVSPKRNKDGHVVVGVDPVLLHAVLATPGVELASVPAVSLSNQASVTALLELLDYLLVADDLNSNLPTLDELDRMLKRQRITTRSFRTIATREITLPAHRSLARAAAALLTCCLPNFACHGAKCIISFRTFCRIRARSVLAFGTTCCQWSLSWRFEVRNKANGTA